MKFLHNPSLFIAGLVTAGLYCSPTVFAQEAAPAEPQTPTQEAMSSPILMMDTVTVIGSTDAEQTLPGSGAFIPTEDIRQQSYSNVNRVLAKVPGVYVREEDGYGNFPNISLRGVDGGRSAKVSIMEDGILSAPAPYSDPAAYYSPNVGRMDAVEVLKGSSQVKYGPHTTGGVINFLSTRVPEEQTFYLKTQYGTDNEWLLHTNFGDTISTEAGNFGYLLESYYLQTDGFREIDERPGFTAGDETGFSKWEPMLKLFWEPKSSIYQRFEAKAGYTRFDADETYLGLTDDDFDADPERRYAGSRYDNIFTEQYRTYLRYIIEPVDALTLTTTAYYNDFSRNWFKLNGVKTEDGTSYGLSQAIAGAGDGEPLSVLKGNSAGSLTLRNNNRSYYSYGLDFRGDWDFATGSVEHELDFGIRFHSDHGERFQRDETFTQDSTGRFVSSKLGLPGAAGNRDQDTDALALYVQDKVSFGKFSIMPGIRYEHLYQEFRDFNTSGNPGQLLKEDSGTLDVVAPGVSLSYEASENLNFFGGVYRGYSTPDPRSHLNDGIDLETSIGYETGVRYRREGFNNEMVLFYTDFEDLIVIDNVGAGGSGSSENAGDVESYGVEYRMAYDPGVVNNWAFNVPLDLSFTYTDATVEGNGISDDAESIFSGAEAGNRVPYVPEFQVSFGVGFEYEKFSLYLDASYTPETYTTASNTSSLRNTSGEPDARFGKTDSAFLVDLTASYQIAENIRAFAGVSNLLGEEYIISRHPEGARGGAPRMFYVGTELTF